MTPLRSRVLQEMGLTEPLIPRNARIVQHYEAKVAQGHMSGNWAFERCCGDIEGRNYHPTAPQRGKSHYAVTVNIIKRESP